MRNVDTELQYKEHNTAAATEETKCLEIWKAKLSFSEISLNHPCSLFVAVHPTVVDAHDSVRSVIYRQE